MPKLVFECPFCRQKVTDGDFCKYCGRPVPEQGQPEPRRGPGSQHTGSGSIKEAAETKPNSEDQTRSFFGISVGGLDSKMLGILLARAELHVVREELDAVIRQIEATRQALLLKQADRELLASRAESLKELFETTKGKHTQLMGVKDSLPIEVIPEDLAVQESKLSKLDKMKGSIDMGVYHEEHERIVLAIESLRKDLSKATDESRKWLKALSKRVGELRRESSRLEARFKIGDVATGLYEESKIEVGRSVRILEEGQELLKSMLAAVRQK